MINEASMRAVDAATFKGQFIRPLYGSYCFSQIPQTVRYRLGAAATPGLPLDTLGQINSQYDHVILFLVDALGWRFIKQYADEYPFLRRIFAEGVVSKLTSQFPSTTAAHVTTIHTGLSPAESGVYEWFYYEPLLDQLIAPLLFSYAGGKERNTLRGAVDPKKLYPTTTLYQDLRRYAVRSTLFHNLDHAYSPYSQVVTAGADVVAFGTLPEALVNLTQRVLADSDRSYYMLYFSNIDSISHRYGPESPQVAAEIDLFLTAMERIFHSAVASRLKKTLFLMTADHGQIAIDPATTIYLNRSMPDIQPYIKTNRAGQLLVPAGSSRDMFLYIKEECLDHARTYLRDQLAGRADVYYVADLVEQGFFGSGAPSQTFLDRVGNLVILPYGNESVWWYEPKKFEQRFYGSHGGLTREEMEIGLLALPYG
jgi:hypothetical protein